MACRLIGAKPLSEQMLDYLNWTLRNKLQWNLNRNFNIFIQENAFESVVCETAAILSRLQCVKLNIKKADNILNPQPHSQYTSINQYVELSTIKDRLVFAAC